MDILIHKLTCSSCGNIFNEPKILPCLHTFCKNCIEAFMAEGSAFCPVCNKKIGMRHIDELSDNVFLHSAFDMLALMKDRESFNCDVCDPGDSNSVAFFRCPECMQYLCELHGSAHLKARATKSHQLFTIDQLLSSWNLAHLNRPACCSQHFKEHLSSFCEQCDYPVCNICIVNEHKGHPHMAIDHASNIFKPTTSNLIGEAKPRIIELRDAISGIEEMCKNISENADLALDDIEECFNRQINTLMERRKQLVTEVQTCRMERLEALHEQRDRLQMRLLSVSEMYSFVNDAVKNGNAADYLDIKNAINEQLQAIIKHKEELDVVEEDYIAFHPNDIATQVAIKFLGYIDTRYAYPPLCTAEGPGLEIARRVEPTVFTVLTKDKKGKLLTRGSDNIEVIIEGKGRKDVQIIDNEDGSYTVTYIPIPISENVVHIYVKGLPILGSPFRVPFNVRDYTNITSPLIILGRYGLNIGEFRSPSGVAIDDKRCLLAVCDRDNIRIQIFDLASYEHVSSIDVSGHMQDGPFDIAIDGKGRLLTTDPKGNGIFVFDGDGNMLYKIGSRGQEAGQFGGLCYIAVDNANNIYICDSDNSRIQVFEERGTLVDCYGNYGNEMRQFNLPAGISIGSNSNIYIADRGNHRIQILDSNGQFIHAFGVRGSLNGEFDFPHGIATDVQNNVIVADHYNTRLQIFNSEGEIIHKIDNIILPHCVACDRCGHIYVTTKDNRIYVF
ncbi:uncharacterized protein TRIADDRAFT_57864 [Trichoplax adhaerens]|uniref:RING-type domain-containing protein n=1 Tax=Trichoplax adhaerens TaxID=10228 RepID=B3S1S1_TRIAD|nr:hypothetical protein TRIADDRAFT_57864 [Trichoplax adhaerens]EDV23022.1 hypothetical protein TRIADDRAFT_57864 [Trichoplax adhaerens]|eukprot:XP_002113932.1 hypothetical protein TRIADDRAFT_57864 [Trichoplax adhaerens]